MKIAVLIVFALLLVVPAWSAPASLLTNPDFTLDKDGDKWPDDWPRVAGASWEIENGKAFLRLRADKPGVMTLLYRRAYLPTPAPALLDVRLRVRHTDVQHGKESWNDARIFAHFKNQADHVLRPEPTFPNFQGSSNGWVDVNLLVKVPKGAQYVEIMPVLFEVASGTFDLALVQVLPATAYLQPGAPVIASTLAPTKGAVTPPELHVEGNKVLTPDGKPVWLQGLCVDSLEWSAGGERIDQSIPVAIEQWKANVIRLPVNADNWFGRGPWQNDGGVAYRKIVDAAIEATASRGAYLALDLHGFGMPFAKDLEFWQDAAERYKNHPAVLFELFNEPHTVTWQEWHDGGVLPEENMKQAANDEEPVSPGMQGLLDAVRARGAHNVVIVGGLDSAYDLTGIMQGFGLYERLGGHGIIYSSHVYPWKKNWQEKMLVAADTYPLFLGEVGSPPLDWKGFDFILPAWRVPLEGWPPDVLAMIQKYKLHWTGFSFHPTCGPSVISDWQYTPTPYWGTYVKAALAGKQYTLTQLH